MVEKKHFKYNTKIPINKTMLKYTSSTIQNSSSSEDKYQGTKKEATKKDK